MSVFAYNPESAKTWANNVVEFLNGGSESVNACSRRFSEQIEKLVQPNVWTGTAASANYHNFMDTHQALISFVNAFGNAFEDSMNTLTHNVAQLEEINLGDTSVDATFGKLTYDQVSSLAEQNIDKEVVRYNYDVIESIGEALNDVHDMLNNVFEQLSNLIGKLNSGEEIWDGDAAESAKETLTKTLRNNYTNVSDTLAICIGNIKTAAANAKLADRA